MKKHLFKKISLNKETLRNLSGHEMTNAVGGMTNTCCNSSGGTVETCGPTCRALCNTTDC